ncbi:hypothetical protein I5P86_04495 [Pseudomonas glycinae]|uniref:hypothetical protein n=1 Tax=Pseudomonas glycinae TaxID=1785145 RepID=UPI0018D74634|nr:hypothetical protein [Pseudomonas glycinae]MBH3404307.1 hypothetical protein [Pseudomonas glycinae]
MFSHESIPLIILFIILLLGVLTAVLHPVHAFYSWLQRRRERSAAEAASEADSH